MLELELRGEERTDLALSINPPSAPDRHGFHQRDSTSFIRTAASCLIIVSWAQEKQEKVRTSSTEKPEAA